MGAEMKTPDEEIAERIINEFGKCHLLSVERIRKIGQRLALGTMTSEEWRLAFEADRENTEREDANKG
jgi:hypothetical protein